MTASANKSDTIKSGDRKSADGRSAKIKSVSYEVGYGRPPRHTQFQKGRSGNPGGRPSRKRVARMRALALREAYRAITVKEGARMVSLTAFVAILRSQIELAATGNLQAQRDFLAMIRAIEQESDGGKVAAIPGERDGGPHDKGG
jgi:hypothetical protein